MGLDLSTFDDVEIGSTQKISTKNKVDIVFVIDSSMSMSLIEFYPTLLNGVDISNKDFNIKEEDLITVGSAKFIVKLVKE